MRERGRRGGYFEEPEGGEVGDIVGEGGEVGC